MKFLIYNIDIFITLKYPLVPYCIQILLGIDYCIMYILLYYGKKFNLNLVRARFCRMIV